MGNRTFLTVASEEETKRGYDHIAFETNNFLAPFWFGLVSRERFAAYKDNLWAAWNDLQPYIEQGNMQEHPEIEKAFWNKLDMMVPWAEGSQLLRAQVPLLLSRYPQLSPALHEWVQTLTNHVAKYETPVLHLEWEQYFGFYEDPESYLMDMEAMMDDWWDCIASFLQDEHLSAYTLGGEHDPHDKGSEEESAKADSDGESLYELPPDDVLTQKSTIPANLDIRVEKQRKQRKWKKELVIWLLIIAIELAAVSVMIVTSRIWLGLLVFFLPVVIAITVMWIRQRSKRPNPIHPPLYMEVGRNDGPALFKADGIVAMANHPPVDVTIAWEHIQQVSVDDDETVWLQLAPEAQLDNDVATVFPHDRCRPAHIAAAVETMLLLRGQKHV